MMSRRRHRWTTAALLAAAAGFWAMAFVAPPLGLDPDEVSDCRGLGVAAIVLLGVRLMIVPLLRQIVELLRAWSFFREGEDAARGERPGGGGLRSVVSDRHVS